MADKPTRHGVHLHSPIAYRPPQDVRDRLLALRDEHDSPVNATITQALREFFGRRDADAR